MSEIKKHFVTFYSPGTFTSEESTNEIPSWDVTLATEMATKVSARYKATPYGFRFTTRGRGPNDLDSKEVAKSQFYWLGGKVETAEEILARDDPRENILRSNVLGNRMKRIITNTNSWKFTSEMADNDVVLDFTPNS